MISSEEVRRSIRGALQLARGDPSGMDKFNATLEGFWNSIAAAAIILPGHAFLAWLSYQNYPAEATTGRILLVESIAYVVGWTLFQLTLFYYCHWIGRGERFFAAAVSLNWADVPLMGFTLGMLALTEIGLMPLWFASFISLCLKLAYICYVSSVALRSSLLAACGPPAFAFAMSWGLQLVTMGLTGQG